MLNAAMDALFESLSTSRPSDERAGPQPLIPAECVSDDGGEIIVLWVPPEHRAGTVGSCDDLCWVARSAWGDLDLEVDTRNAFDHLNHLPHRETMTIAAIKRH